MVFAQFYRRSTVDPAKLVEGCGDHAVVILDGRSPQRHQAWAREECHKRGYVAWQLMKGDRFTDARPISEIEMLI